jgi:hypothetical protein
LICTGRGLNRGPPEDLSAPVFRYDSQRMEDKKKLSFFRAQWEGWKAKALYDLVKYAAGAALLSLSGLAVFTGPKLMSAIYLFAALMGLYFMVSAFLLRKNIPAGYDPRLASGLLRMDAEELLRRYKELDFDSRDEARLPLDSSSWPQFGQPWSYVHMSLCSNARNVHNTHCQSSGFLDSDGNSNRACTVLNKRTVAVVSGD